MNIFSALQKDARDFTTLTPQVKFLMGIQIFVLFVFSLLVGVLFSPKFNDKVKQNPNTTLQSGMLQQAKANLTIAPQDVILKLGEEKELSVELKDADATAADIVLEYDPAVVEVSQPVMGTYFQREIVNKIDNGTSSNSFSPDANEPSDAPKGRVFFSAAKDSQLSAQQSSNNTTSKNTVFTFTVKPIAKTETSFIEFVTPDTIVAEKGENILGVTTPVQIHVFD